MFESQHQNEGSETCRHCAGWTILESDFFCSACGRSLLPIDVIPESLEIVTGLGDKGRILTIKNLKQVPAEVDWEESSGRLSLDRKMPVILAPGERIGVPIRVDSTKFPSGFGRLDLKPRIILDQDKKRTFSVHIHVVEGPLPQAGPIEFGRLEEGMVGRSEMVLSNRGAVPCELVSIRTEGSRQLVVILPKLPLRLAPRQELRLQAEWDTILPGSDPHAAASEVVLAFSHGQELRVPVHAELYRRLLAFSPARLEVSKALAKHDHLVIANLENRGTVDIEVTAVSSEVDWIRVIGVTSFVLKAEPLTLNDPGLKLPPTRARSVRLLCCAARLPEGTQVGRIFVHTNDGPPIQLEVAVEVIQPKPFPSYVGIDFGTTNSVLAILEGDDLDSIELVQEPDNQDQLSPLIPSVLVFDESPEIYSIGWRARRQIAAAADRSVRSIKRVLGTANRHTFFDRTFSATEIAALVIRRLIQLAERHLFQTRGIYWEIRKAILTVPANFLDSQIGAILDAAESAGIDCEIRHVTPHGADALAGENVPSSRSSGIVLDEPSAAALLHLCRLEQKDLLATTGNGPRQSTRMREETRFRRGLAGRKGLRALIYDYGGGTLDVSLAHLVRLKSGRVELKILANQGDNQIGGDSIDLAILREMATQCGTIVAEFDESLITSSFRQLEARRQAEGWKPDLFANILAARNRWKDFAEQAKIELTSVETTTVRLGMHEILIAGPAGPIAAKSGVSLELARATVDSLIEPLLERSDQLIASALAAAKLKADDIDLIFHTGRQSQMKSIRKRVRGLLPKLEDADDILDPQDLKVCVAKGAAFYGILRRGLGGGVQFTNRGRVLPCSYGYARRELLSRSVFEEVIPRGSYYPIEKTVHFSPDQIAADNWLHLKIYQNSGIDKLISKESREIRLIGQVNLDTLEDGQPGCDVRFVVDANRCLEVFADDKEVPIERETWEEEDGWSW